MKPIEKAILGKRLSFEEALDLYKNAPLHILGHIAHTLRLNKTDPKVVTYAVDRNINYTNVCVCKCKFCAFYRDEKDKDAYVISFDELYKKIKELVEVGGNHILLQGSHHPSLPLEFYVKMLRFIKKEFPLIHIHAFSPPEIVHFSKLFNKSIEEILDTLIEAGLDSIPGGGAEILVDDVRKKISPNKCSTYEWLYVMEVAHKKGLKTSATMMFGHVETLKDRIEHLCRLRDLQDKTGGFTAFIPWTFQPSNTSLSHLRKATSIEYLRTLAISRIYLDNFKNIQVSWVTMGDKIAQMGLFFGANDFGSTMMEENVVASTGVKFRLSKQQIIELVKEAGFEPKQRRMDYSLVE